MDKNQYLRALPKVDELLAHPALRAAGGRLLLTEAIREELADLRGGGANPLPPANEGTATPPLPSTDEIAKRVLARIARYRQPSLCRVINGTGVVLHTNLGRAPLPEEALAAITETARGYSNLEYDIPTGTRDTRHAHIEALLTHLTGAEAAMAVNNNAAAVLLALSATATGAGVITSRGELVEIGGGFRIPDICAQSGARLVEIGTTNRTHLRDYEAALEASEKAVVLRVHASNFKMTGFVTRPGLAALAALAHAREAIIIEDLGSGALLPTLGQPTVAESIRGGADIVTFSGDKLPGGPQAGLIAGRKDLIDKMKAHPLARAVRIDKLSLAALEATLWLYLDPETASQKIPVLHMLEATPTYLQEKAERLAALLAQQDPLSRYNIRVVTLDSHAGGGAMPEEALPSRAVAITQAETSPQAIEAFFRKEEVPIIGRIARGDFLLDVRTINEADFPLVAARFGMLCDLCD